MPPLLGSIDGPDHTAKTPRARRAAESLIRRADAASPLGTLAGSDALRERTVDAIQRVLDTGRTRGPGDGRTGQLLRRYEAARGELSAATFELAAAWRVGDRSPAVLRAIAKLQNAVNAAQEKVEARPDGLLATKQAELARYRRELDATRFAVTPSREAALEELLEAVVQGRPVLMLGPSGTGKTTIVRELARRLQSDLEIIPGNEVTAGQLWGTRGLDPMRGDVIRDGIVARAMVEKDGKLLLWDEANASEEAMEKFLKFKAYLTTRAGDAVRVPAENPELRTVGKRFGFILTGNPKGQKHTNRAEFPPEVARELGEVRLEYLPEEELYDLAIAQLLEGETVPLGIEEVRADGVLHNLVKFVHEVQNLYLGESAARGVAGAPTLRKLVIDPGMVTAWLTGWGYARASRGESLASYLDRQLVALANSEKYPAEDRALVVQTAARFHFLAADRAKAALRVPGLAANALAAFTPFAPPLYAADRDPALSLSEIAALHPYVDRRLDQWYVRALSDVAAKAGKTPAVVQSVLIGSSVAERLQELHGMLRASAEDLTKVFATGVAAADTPPGPPPPGSPPEAAADLAKEVWSLAEMRLWLRTARDMQGRSLESHLEGGSLDAQVQKYLAAYRDGPWGFEVDPQTILFPSSRASLEHLAKGLESGAIDGIVIEAYPTRDAMKEIALKDAAATNRDADTMYKELLAMPTVEFQLRHFEARGGTIFDRDQRLAKWKGLRSVAKNGFRLWESFHAFAGAKGSTPVDWTDANGARTPTYIDFHKRIHDAVVTSPPSVGASAGNAVATFTNIDRDVPDDGKILSADGVSQVTQGDGLTFVTLLQGKIDTLTPAEYLAFTAGTSDPSDIDSYPAPQTWDWVAGIDDTYAALACSASDGLRLGWHGPDSSLSNFRVRSVVR